MNSEYQTPPPIQTLMEEPMKLGFVLAKTLDVP